MGWAFVDLQILTWLELMNAGRSHEGPQKSLRHTTQAFNHSGFLGVGHAAILLSTTI